MNSYNAYEKLYANTKANFTIVKNEHQYSLGEYMLMKATNKRLPSKKCDNVGTGIVSHAYSFVKDKLTVKNPPQKDKTIRRFPLRTSASALLSAMLVCAMVLSFGIFAGKSIKSEAPLAQEPHTSDVNEESSVDFEK